MATGRPDWYGAGQSSVISTLADMAELAVRLRSPVNYARGGKAVWIDTFTRFDGSYIVSSSGVLSGPAVSSVYAESDDSSLLTTLNIGAGNNIAITKHSRVWNTQILGVEYAFFVNYMPSSMIVSLRHYREGTDYSGTIRFNNSFLALETQNQDGSYTQRDSRTIPYIGLTFFNALHLSIDTENFKFKNMRINDLTFDLTAVNLRTFTTTEANEYFTAIQVNGNAGQQLAVYIDRLILYQDE